MCCPVFTAASLTKIAEQMNLKHLNRPVFGTLTLLNEDFITGKDLKEYENVNIVSSVNMSGEMGSLSVQSTGKNMAGCPVLLLHMPSMG